MMMHPTGERLYEFLDGRLGEDELRAVASHLDGCAACRREVEIARGIERAARNTVVDTSTGFTDAVMARILADASAPAPAVRPSGARARRLLVPVLLAAIYLAALLMNWLPGNDPGAEGGWGVGTFTQIDRTIGHLGELAGRMAGGSGGIALAAIAAVAGLIAIDSLIGRRIPRGRH
jgi:hypothetical protein